MMVQCWFSSTNYCCSSLLDQRSKQILYVWDKSLRKISFSSWIKLMCNLNVNSWTAVEKGLLFPLSLMPNFWVKLRNNCTLCKSFICGTWTLFNWFKVHCSTQISHQVQRGETKCPRLSINSIHQVAEKKPKNNNKSNLIFIQTNWKKPEPQKLHLLWKWSGNALLKAENVQSKTAESSTEQRTFAGSRTTKINPSVNKRAKQKAKSRWNKSKLTDGGMRVKSF